MVVNGLITFSADLFQLYLIIYKTEPLADKSRNWTHEDVFLIGKKCPENILAVQVWKIGFFRQNISKKSVINDGQNEIGHQ